MRSLLAVLTVVFVSTGLSISLLIARADQPKSENTPSESNTECVDVRFARAHLELAKLDLRRAVEGNKRIRNLFPAALIDKLQLHVVIDEERLEQCLIGEDADSHQTCIRSAQAAVKIAKADLKRKRGIHQRMPTNASALIVERAGVVEKLATFNLERIQHLEESESVLMHLQWQIDQLQHQVLELQLAARS